MGSLCTTLLLNVNVTPNVGCCQCYHHHPRSSSMWPQVFSLILQSCCRRRRRLFSCPLVQRYVVFPYLSDPKKIIFTASCVFTKFVKIYRFQFFFFVKRYLAFCLFLYLFGKFFFFVKAKTRRISLFRNSLYNRGSSSSNCWFPT